MRTFEDDRSASSAMATSRSGTRSSSREEGFLGFLGMEIFSSPATYHRRSRSRAWRRSIGTSRAMVRHCQSGIGIQGASSVSSGVVSSSSSVSVSGGDWIVAIEIPPAWVRDI